MMEPGDDDGNGMTNTMMIVMTAVMAIFMSIVIMKCKSFIQMQLVVYSILLFLIYLK